MMIRINDTVSVDEAEITFAYVRSPGPGGQNVNKVATSVTLRFDLTNSTSLTAIQRNRILRKLATRINKEGVLRVVSRRHRTQAANRREALARFVELLAGALRQPRPRRKTKPTRGSIERRLAEKARRSKQKTDRGYRYRRGDD